jgi:ornithine--oxo-acid transaminase
MYHFESIRFTPPLVISEEDLQQAIEVIRQALIDLDQVRGPALPSHVTDGSRPFTSQLEEIPGEVESEKGFRDELND